MKKFLMTAAVAALFPALANAADLGPSYYNKAPPLPPVPALNSPFSGFYVGANAGYASADATVLGVDLNPTGFTGGVQAGYNVIFGGNFLIGVEGSAGLANLSNTTQAIDLGNGFLGGVAGRAGVTFGQVLVYTKGGWAYYNASQLTSGINGFQFGGGAEWAFTRNVSLKAEYTRIDFGNQTIDKLSVPVTANTFTGGVNYHF